MFWMFVISCIFFLPSEVYAIPLPSEVFLDIDGISIAPGVDHICVIETHLGSPVGGKARCWGEDVYGRLKVPKNSFFVQIVSGQFFSCGVTLEQRVICWGRIHLPQRNEVPGLFSQISAGQFFVCGVKTDGRLSCWGSAEKEILQPQLPVDRLYVQVSCANDHCCALDDSGHAHCWGGLSLHDEKKPPVDDVVIDADGEIVPNFVIQAPVVSEDIELDGEGYQQTDLPEGYKIITKHPQFKQIATGMALSCGITLEDASIRCWGNHQRHKLPRDTNILSNSVSGGSDSYRQVSVGKLGICGVTEEGKLHCWGLATSRIPNEVFTEDISYGGWDQVSVSNNIICAVSQESRLWCWGGGEMDVNAVPLDLEVA